jgi:hypothetical protein
MDNHPSFCGDLKSSDAETMLKRHGGNCYLTRYSRFQKKLRISVQRKLGRKLVIQHMNLSIEKANDEEFRYEIEGTEKIFNSIYYLLDYYQNQKINNTIDGIGHCYKTPVQNQIDYKDNKPPPVLLVPPEHSKCKLP